MKILLTTDRTVGYGQLQRNGDVIEVCDEEANRLIGAGQAEHLKKSDPTETQTREFKENASLRISRQERRQRRARDHGQ